MALQSALVPGARSIAGRGVWVGTSFSFPALTLFNDDSVALAVVPFGVVSAIPRSEHERLRSPLFGADAARA